MPSLSEPPIRQKKAAPCTVASALTSALPYRPLNWTVPALAFVALAVFAAYSSVLFNWFAGDDFVHLIWLKEAIHNPEMVLRNFHSNWLEVKTTKFYRPLISVFMLTDYAAWGTNGFGFHLTNVLFLIASCVCIFLITKSLLNRGSGLHAQVSAFMASLLFGLYPLHSESVAWITGRVDTVVTAFYLASVWCYMRWRETGNRWAAACTCIFMTLGLLSKEMAIMLPATFFVYELFLKPKAVNSSAQKTEDHSGQKSGPSDNGGGGGTFIAAIISALKNTAPFWLMLAAYFVVRRFALGTFVGGYDDSLGIGDLGKFAQMWLHSLSMMFVPVNRELMSPGNVYVYGWKIALLACAIITIGNFVRDSFLRRRILFLVGWAAISLLPVYKLFSISDDLQGSRLAYLCTAPLACLLGMALAKLDFGTSKCSNEELTAPGTRSPDCSLKSSLVQTGSILLLFALPTCAYSILTKNNSAWADAGAASNSIRSSLEKFYIATGGDPQVLLLGVPDNIHGAYVSRNAIDGMTKAPQLSREIKNCLPLYRTEQIIPFGYLKESIGQREGSPRIVYWSKNNSELSHVDTAKLSERQLPVGIAGAALSNLLTAVDGSCIVAPIAGGISVIPTAGGKWAKLKIKFPTPLNCFATDFIAISVCPGSSPVTESGAAANTAFENNLDLFFKNDIVSSIDNEHQVHGNPVPEPSSGNRKRTVSFALHAQPDWALGGQSSELVLRLPTQSPITIRSISTVNTSSVMPKLSAVGAGFAGTKGFLHLCQSHPTETVQYDAAAVAGAKGEALEITRVNQVFEEQNTPSSSRFAAREISLPGNKGSTQLKLQDFPQPGLYEVRPWALARNGKHTGVSGDHLIVSVD